MHCAEVKYYLNDYSRGILLDEIRADIHEHLDYCKSCAKVLDDMISIGGVTSAGKKFVRQNKKSWMRVYKESEKKHSPQKIVPRIFPASSKISSETSHIKNSLMLKTNEIENNKLFVIAGIISVVAFGVILAFIVFDHSPSAFWSVEKVSGYPMIESHVLIDQGILKIGEKLFTDSESRARLKLGLVGEIEIEPKSEIQIIETKTSEHRLILSKGQIAARTWVTSKLFSIKTPSAVVTDLGCKYDLSVDEQASTLIQVKSGWVLMEYKNRRVLLCTETTCVSDSSKGLGVPISNEASSVFKESLNKLDFINSSKNELVVLLSEANQKDFITLFHLLKRLDNESRGMIYDRISLLFRMPQRITREGIVHGDKDMMGRLWTELGLGSISMYHNL